MKWTIRRIEDLGEVVGGATPSTKNLDYWDGDIPWITPKDLTNYRGRYISAGARNITEKGLNNSSAKILPAGSVLFSSRAPIGYVAIALNPVCTNQGFKSIVPNQNVDALFLYYLLEHNKTMIESHGSGTTFREISGTTMKSIELCVPEEIDDQRTIAFVLNALDSKIELNSRINDYLEQIAESIWGQATKNENYTCQIFDVVDDIITGKTPSTKHLHMSIKKWATFQLKKGPRCPTH